MSISPFAKAIIGGVALAASTALGFLPHDDPWFNVLTGIVAIAGTYGIYQVKNKPTPRQEAIGAAVGAVASDLAAAVPEATAATAVVTPVYQPAVSTPPAPIPANPGTPTVL